MSLKMLTSPMVKQNIAVSQSVSSNFIVAKCTVVCKVLKLTKHTQMYTDDRRVIATAVKMMVATITNKNCREPGAK